MTHPDFSAEESAERAAALAGMRALHNRGRSGAKFASTSYKNSGGTCILLLADEPLFCGGLARLADRQHLPTSIFWTATELDHAPFWNFDIAIVDGRQWDELQSTAGRKLIAALAHIPIVLVESPDGGEVSAERLAQSRFPLQVVARCQRSEGPAAALELALKAVASDAAHALPVHAITES